MAMPNMASPVERRAGGGVIGLNGGYDCHPDARRDFLSIDVCLEMC
jgi:hypothetical protein